MGHASATDGRPGWSGGLRPTLARELLTLTTCGTVEDPGRPVEAVPARYAATAARPGIHSAGRLATLVAALVDLDPASDDYGLTFVGATDPLTTRLRTVTTTAFDALLRAPSTTPGRWAFTAPDHRRWLVNRPWDMDVAFIGCTAAVADALSAADRAVVVTSPARLTHRCPPPRPVTSMPRPVSPPTGRSAARRRERVAGDG